MKKFDKVKRAGHKYNQGMFQEGELVIKEKLDGANFRFTVTENGELLFGTRNVEYKIDGEPDYEENVDSRFKAAIEHVREQVDAERVRDIYGTQYTFFGENMVKHSLDYDWENTPQFVGFDVYDEDAEKYLHTDQAYNLINKIGLACAPIIERLPAEDFDISEFDAAQESEFRDGAGEGVVIINEDAEENDLSGFNTRAKMVTDEFEEKHEESMGGGKQDGDEPEGHNILVRRYCTDGRINKHIHKMRDEGRDLSMQLMANQDDSTGLPIRVAQDIVEEEYEDIVRLDQAVDFKRFRSDVATQCVSRLRAMMQGEAK